MAHQGGSKEAKSGTALPVSSVWARPNMRGDGRRAMFGVRTYARCVPDVPQPKLAASKAAAQSPGTLPQAPTYGSDWPQLPAVGVAATSFCSHAEAHGTAGVRDAVFRSLPRRLSTQGVSVCDELAEALAQLGLVADLRHGAEAALQAMLEAPAAPGCQALLPAEAWVQQRYVAALQEARVALVLGDVVALAHPNRASTEKWHNPPHDPLVRQQMRLQRSIAFLERYATDVPRLLQRDGNRGFLHPVAVQLVMVGWATAEARHRLSAPELTDFVASLTRRPHLLPAVAYAAQHVCRDVGP